MMSSMGFGTKDVEQSSELIDLYNIEIRSNKVVLNLHFLKRRTSNFRSDTLYYPYICIITDLSTDLILQPSDTIRVTFKIQILE